MRLYVARDRDGWIALYLAKPKRLRGDWVVVDGDIWHLPDASWPEVKPGECRRLVLAKKPKTRRKP